MLYVSSTQSETACQVLKRSVQLYRIAFLRLIGIAIFIAILSFLPRFIALYVKQPVASSPQPFNFYILWFILIDFLSFILFTIMLWRLSCVMANKHESLQEDLLVSLKRMPRIIGAALVETGIVVAFYFMTFGVFFYAKNQSIATLPHTWKSFLIVLPLVAQMYLNIFIVVLLMFYLPLILTENKHIFEALGKSMRLVWGHWWRTLTIQATPWLFYLISLLLLKYIFHLSIPMGDAIVPSFFATLVHACVYACFLPWAATTLMVQLNDLEIKQSLSTS